LLRCVEALAIAAARRHAGFGLPEPPYLHSYGIARGTSGVPLENMDRSAAMSSMAETRPPENASISERIAALDWPAIALDLDSNGCAVVGPILTARECIELAGSYTADSLFRSRVVMARHGFGRGEYKYFAYPLAPVVAALRDALYSPLAEVANRWNAMMGGKAIYPADHADYLKRCHHAGQAKPTPLLLRYGPGDFNCLHQDIYGENVFPLQVTILLSRPETDFAGGAFVLTEQRPRMQSRAEVVALQQGEAVIFPVRYRPVRGTRGIYRVNMRHGVSRLVSGSRHTLGIIFHDAA
jgi:uncharacterized protein